MDLSQLINEISAPKSSSPKAWAYKCSLCHGEKNRKDWRPLLWWYLDTCCQISSALGYQQNRKAKHLFSTTNTIRSMRTEPLIRNSIAIAHESQTSQKEKNYWRKLFRRAKSGYCSLRRIKSTLLEAGHYRKLMVHQGLEERCLFGTERHRFVSPNLRCPIRNTGNGEKNFFQWTNHNLGGTSWGQHKGICVLLVYELHARPC